MRRRAGHRFARAFDRCARPFDRALASRCARACAAFALAFCALFATACSPEDLPESSPQGGTSTEESQLENRLNPMQLPDSSFIYDATISSLEKADSYMDAQTVQVVGEAVGDRVMSEVTPAYCWITLEAVDGTYAEVAVFMSERASQAIDTYGAYGRTGTTLQVRGTFNLACADHEGVSDLHATNVTVVQKGHANETPFNMAQVVPGLILVALGAGLLFAFRRLQEHEL